MPEKLILPNNWDPRPDQLSLWNYLAGGGKRAIELAHRRWGKDDVALHWTACSAMRRVGTYWHMLPEYGQARKAVWDAVNPKTGMRRIDEAFPEAIRESTRTQDMFIRFINGSTWSLVGSDNYNSLVGSPPVGLVFSEYALADPKAWGYLRPVLAENGGWALFITTVRGKNHAWDLYQMATETPGWFAELLTIDDTRLLTPEQLAQEEEEYKRTYGPDEGRALFRQEWYNDVNAVVGGTFYGDLIDIAKAERRITNVPYEPLLPVHTAWDIGMRDAMVVWFIQVSRDTIRVIDYYEDSSGGGLPKAVKEVRAKPYVYDTHFFPHDIAVREPGSGKSRWETVVSLGITPTKVPSGPGSWKDGVNAVRMTLPRMWFDKQKCARGLDALEQYRAKKNPTTGEYTDKEVEDWTNHAADALRMFCYGYRPSTPKKTVSETLGRYHFAGAW